MTSAESGDIKNVSVALTSGANVNVHHNFDKVSILIIIYVLLIVLVVYYFKVLL